MRRPTPIYSILLGHLGTAIVSHEPYCRLLSIQVLGYQLARTPWMRKKASAPERLQTACRTPKVILPASSIRGNRVERVLADETEALAVVEPAEAVRVGGQSRLAWRFQVSDHIDVRAVQTAGAQLDDRARFGAHEGEPSADPSQESRRLVPDVNDPCQSVTTR